MGATGAPPGSTPLWDRRLRSNEAEVGEDSPGCGARPAAPPPLGEEAEAEV